MAPRAKKARSTAEPASPAVSSDDLQKRLDMVKMITMRNLAAIAPPAAAAASSSKAVDTPAAESSASASTLKPTPAASVKEALTVKKAPATRSKPAASAAPSTPVAAPIASKKGKGKATAPPAVASSAAPATEDIPTPVAAASTPLKRPLPDSAEEEVDQLISSPPAPASPAVPKSVKNKLKKEKKQAKAAAKKEGGDKGKDKEQEQEKEQAEVTAPAAPSSAIKQASEKAVKLPKRKALKAAAAASASTPAESTPAASTSTTTADKAAVPPTPAQVKVKKALKRARSDSTSSSRPHSPARKPSTTTAAPKSASKSNKRRKLSPAPAPAPSSSQQPIDPTAPPTLSSLYPTFLTSLQRAHPTAFTAPHTGPMFDTIRKFLLELRGSGAEGDAALFEFFKALVRSGAGEGVESVWKRAKEEVGGEAGVDEEEEKSERKRGKEERRRKRTEEKAARRAERKMAEKAEKRQKQQQEKGAVVEEEESAPAASEEAPKDKGKGKGKEVVAPTPAPAPVDTPAEDAMEVDELASQPQETDEQRQAREHAESAERLAKKKAKKEKQEARKAAEKEQKRLEAEEAQKSAAVSPAPAVEEEEPIIKVSDSQLAAAAVPLPPSPVPDSQPKPNGIVPSVDPKSSPSKERRFRTNRLGKKEKEELRSSRQSSVNGGNESDAGLSAVAPAETQSEKPTITADEVEEPVAEPEQEQDSQPEPATQDEEAVTAALDAVEKPQDDAMEVDEPIAAPSPAQPQPEVEAEPESEKMDEDPSAATEAQPQLPNDDLSPEPEQHSSLAAAPTSIIAMPAIFARADSLKSRYSVASSEEDPDELELSLKQHCSPAKNSTRLPSVPAESSSPAPPAPPSEDLYAPLSQRPEALKPKSPTKPEEVPLPPSRSASPEDEEEERVAPPPLRRQDTIGGGDSDSDSSSSDDDSSDEQSSDEDFAPQNARPRVKRTSLSAVAAAAFGKPGTPRAKSNLGKVTSPRRNQSQLSQSTVRPADEEDEFDQLLSQSQPRKRLSIAHVLPQDDDEEGKVVGGGDDEDGASSNFSPVASSVEGTPRVAKKKAPNGKSRDSSEEPDTVDEDEEMATNVVSNSRVNGDDALGFVSPKLNGTPSTTANGHVDLPPSSAAMAPTFSSQSASQQPQPHYNRLSAIGSAASSQAGDNSFEPDELTQSPNLAQGQAQPTSEESQWQGLPQKDSPLFLVASQVEESQALGQPGESQLREVQNESMDPWDQTQVAFPVDGNGLPKGLSEHMDQADTPQKIVVTAPTDDESGLQTLHGGSPSPAPSGRLTRSSAASRATTRSPSPGPSGPTKPRAAATAAAKRTTRGASASVQSTPKAAINGATAPTSSASQPTPTARKATPKAPSASQPLPSTTSRLGARSASQMKSLSQLDAISSTPKARTTRSRTAPVAPATAPAAAKWTKRNDESSDEEEESSDEEVGATTTTRSGRKSVGTAKGRKSLW